MVEWTVAGSLIWQARTDAQLTQRELAEAAGVPQSTIAAIESGRRQPSIPLLQRILHGAGKDLRFVLAALDDHDGSITRNRRRGRKVAATFRSARVIGERSERGSRRRDHPRRPQSSHRRIIVIGAWAVEAQGIVRAHPTRDVDVTPRATTANLRRLSAALRELGARIRAEGVAAGLVFDHDATSLARSQMWNLICPAGEFDISFAPSGFASGYDDLVKRAVVVELAGGTRVRVAAVRDVIESKRKAGREKDITALPEIITQARQRGLIE